MELKSVEGSKGDEQIIWLSRGTVLQVADEELNKKRIGNKKKKISILDAAAESQRGD